jgi:hypothetical protein
LQRAETFAITDAEVLGRLVTCEVASLRGPDNRLKPSMADLFLRWFHIDDQHCTRIMRYLSAVEQRLNQSMASILDEGFNLHLSGVPSQLLFEQWVNPNLESVLAARNGEGKPNTVVPQLHRVGDWKLFAGAWYTGGRVVSILTTLGAGKKWKTLYDEWLSQPAGGELGWYYRAMAEMLAASEDIVTMMKDKFAVSVSHRWVEVRSLLAMEFYLCFANEICGLCRLKTRARAARRRRRTNRLLQATREPTRRLPPHCMFGVR